MASPEPENGTARKDVTTPPQFVLDCRAIYQKKNGTNYVTSLAGSQDFHLLAAAAMSQLCCTMGQDPAMHYKVEGARAFLEIMLRMGDPKKSPRGPASLGMLERT
jgi:hypothetical protein